MRSNSALYIGCIKSMTKLPILGFDFMMPKMSPKIFSHIHSNVSPYTVHKNPSTSLPLIEWYLDLTLNIVKVKSVVIDYLISLHGYVVVDLCAFSMHKNYILSFIWLLVRNWSQLSHFATFCMNMNLFCIKFIVRATPTLSHSISLWYAPN